MPHKREFNNSQKKLYSLFEKLNINGVTHFHPRLHTVDESKQWHDIIKGSHCKNLFLKDKKGNFILIVAHEDTQIKLNHLHKKIDTARLSFANSEKLYEFLQVRPGSVTPYALINAQPQSIKIILDDEMMQQDILNFHPLENWATTSIKPEQLITFIKSCGHDYKIVNFTQV
ncbi:MAG: prolyl-tRNA synthetase associated domain-containing protein [Rhizobiales bacterium]|nr:prolyl-tRNA synthetase associated domain-containing protein [Hyphomicrobiales bacterium]